MTDIRMSNNDLISREALKKKIELYRTGHNAGTDYENGIIDGYDFCLDEINNAPTVETSKIEHKAYSEGFKDGVDQGIKLSEKPQGKWDEICLGARCSVCGKSYPYPENTGFNDIVEMFKYCPNCGAKMKHDTKQ